MSDEANTFTMKLAGRDIEFRRTHLGQVIMLQRTALRAIQKATSDSGDEADRIVQVSSAMVKVLDFIDKLVVNEDDRQFIEDQMLEGAIEWQDLMAALGGGKEKQPADDEAPRKRAPRKSPKAAPAKSAATVASRGRAKR